MKVVSVGVDYCLTHDGIRNADDEAVCDFARIDNETTACSLRPLFYVEDDS